MTQDSIGVHNDVYGDTVGGVTHKTNSAWKGHCAMETIFIICAVIGGVIMLCQFVLTLLGLGGAHDVGGDHEVSVGHDFAVEHGVDHDGAPAEHGAHESTGFFKLLSFRAVVAALTFFGLGGLAALYSGSMAHLALPAGVGAGAAAMFVVAWMMRILHNLDSEGTVRIERAVGTTGAVYLTVPARDHGVGKVTVTVQNRTMEYKAVTQGSHALPMGTSVVVVGVVGPDTVEVGLPPA